MSFPDPGGAPRLLLACVGCAAALLLTSCDIFGFSGGEEDSSPAEGPAGTVDARDVAERIQAIDQEVEAAMSGPDTDPDSRSPMRELKQAVENIEELPGVARTVVHEKATVATVALENGLSVAINNHPTFVEASSGATSAEGDLKEERTSRDGESGEAASDGGRGAADDRQDPTSGRKQVGEGRVLPGSGTAIVAAPFSGTSEAEEIEGDLEQAGYDISPLGGSLRDMRQYSGAGMLYLDTHGVVFQEFVPRESEDSLDPDSMRYGIQTGTEVEINEEWVSEHEQDLASGKIVLAISADGEGQPTARVAITDRFVREHWDLSSGLAFVHACMLGADEVEDARPIRMQNAILESARSLVAFDNVTATRPAWPSIQRAFDLFLGQFPYQQHWTFAQVQATLKALGLSTFPLPNNSTFGLTTKHEVDLVYKGAGDLAITPFLRRIDVRDRPTKGEGVLRLHGHFGSEEGSVEVDRTALEVEKWTEETIRVRAPTDGPTSTGEVIVHSDAGPTSNPAQLTKWKGAVFGHALAGYGTLRADASATVSFRAEIGRTTGSPMKRPQPPEKVETHFASASGGVRGSGTYTDSGTPDITAEWKGENEFRILNRSEVEGGVPPARTDVVEMDGNELEHDSFVGGKVILRPREGEAELCYRMFGKVTEEFYYHPPDDATESWEFGFAYLHDLQDHSETTATNTGLTCVPLQMAQSDKTLSRRPITVDKPNSDLKIEAAWENFEAVNLPVVN
jgi:hypothetical protein